MKRKFDRTNCFARPEIQVVDILHKNCNSSGRIKRLSEITYDVKHPIILDGRHRLVHLLLQHLHDLHYHQGVDFMRAQVQQTMLFSKLGAACVKLKVPVWCVVLERLRRSLL